VRAETLGNQHHREGGARIPHCPTYTQPTSEMQAARSGFPRIDCRRDPYSPVAVKCWARRTGGPGLAAPASRRMCPLETHPEAFRLSLLCFPTRSMIGEVKLDAPPASVKLVIERRGVSAQDHLRLALAPPGTPRKSGGSRWHYLCLVALAPDRRGLGPSVRAHGNGLLLRLFWTPKSRFQEPEYRDPGPERHGISHIRFARRNN